MFIRVFWNSPAADGVWGRFPITSLSSFYHSFLFALSLPLSIVCVVEQDAYMLRLPVGRKNPSLDMLPDKFLGIPLDALIIRHGLGVWDTALKTSTAALGAYQQQPQGRLRRDETRRDMGCYAVATMR